MVPLRGTTTRHVHAAGILRSSACCACCACAAAAAAASSDVAAQHLDGVAPQRLRQMSIHAGVDAIRHVTIADVRGQRDDDEVMTRRQGRTLPAKKRENNTTL